MKAIEPTTMVGEAVVFAKDHATHDPLPARKTEDGLVITEWVLTPEERWRISTGENIQLTIATFNQDLQPVKLEVTSEAT